MFCAFALTVAKIVATTITKIFFIVILFLEKIRGITTVHENPLTIL
jgi:hypothetical protein